MEEEAYSDKYTAIIVPQGIAMTIAMDVIRSVPTKRGMAPNPTALRKQGYGVPTSVQRKNQRVKHTQKKRNVSPIRETTIPTVMRTALKAQRKKKNFTMRSRRWDFTKLFVRKEKLGLRM